jgi:hypothetical protein
MQSIPSGGKDNAGSEVDYSGNERTPVVNRFVIVEHKNQEQSGPEQLESYHYGY